LLLSERALANTKEKINQATNNSGFLGNAADYYYYYYYYSEGN
jgi:hypothetical protein